MKIQLTIPHICGHRFQHTFEEQRPPRMWSAYVRGPLAEHTATMICPDCFFAKALKQCPFTSAQRVGRQVFVRRSPQKPLVLRSTKSGTKKVLVFAWLLPPQRIEFYAALVHSGPEPGFRPTGQTVVVSALAITK